MPTYVYRCSKGHRFELFHAISDDTPRKCPKCRSAARRVPAGGAGLLFKGSGFHVTDYRSHGYRESAKQEQGATGSSPASGGAGEGAKGAPGETPGAGGASGGSGAPRKPAGKRRSRGKD